MCSFRCKMCGGTLTILEDKNIAVCDYCGSKQSIPRLQSEVKMDQYARASTLRRNNEYDKASALYEVMLNDNPCDADLYWSLVLCKYGIEYVLDAKTSKRIPTINRNQYTSIYDDENYKAAIKYADENQREVFTNEAKVINDIQSDILLISQNEDPFDIFICYKETDEDGRRSEDSLIASNLYHQLVNEGYKVFFAKVTLEDKLGSAYEPYIFAALNSAKVMLAIGTRKEHFEAVWVKNEWSRFLSLMNEDNEKVLIPLYKDMDAYDLPSEFSHLQAQDMTKIGFSQDLIHGINKIIDKKNESLFTSRNALYGSTIGMVTRAELLIEDKEYTKAKQVLEEALNTNPKDPMIYVLQLLIEFKLSYVSELVNVTKDFTTSKNYEKALRFSDDELANKLKSYANERIYLIAKKNMAEIKDTKKLEEAKSLFESIKYYKNSSLLATTCKNKIIEIETKEKYDKASNLILKFKQKRFNYKQGIERLDEAINILKEISTYNDANDLINECNELKSSSTKVHLKQKKITVALASVMVVTVIGLTAGFKYVDQVYLPNKEYEEAIQNMNNKNYIEALEAFNDLGDYKDSSLLINETYYLMGSDSLRTNDYDKAINIFRSLDNYKDSNTKLLEARYAKALKTYNEASESDNKYLNGINDFASLGNYKDSLDLVNQIQYNYALYLYNLDRYEEAIGYFELVDNYEEEVEKYIDKCEYGIVEDLYHKHDYFGALDEFKHFHLDRNTKLYEDIIFKIGKYYLDRGEYTEAIKYLSKEDSKRNNDLINEVKYNYVLDNDDKDNMTTYNYLRELRRANYKDSAQIYNKIYGWNLAIFAINRDVNSAYNRSNTFDGESHLVFHFKVSGGAPDETLNLRVKYKLSDGEDGSFYFDRAFKDGDIDWVSFSNIDSSKEETLELNVSFRDRDNGHEIGEAIAIINNPIVGNNNTVVNTKIVNGFYVGEAYGYNGYLTVNVKVSGGKISDVKVIEHNEESEAFDAIDEMERRIIKAGNTNVDVVAGSTITSRAIIDAVNNALNTEE